MNRIAIANAVQILQLAGYGVTVHPNLQSATTMLVRRRDQTVAMTLAVANGGVCLESVEYLAVDAQQTREQYRG